MSRYRGTYYVSISHPSALLEQVLVHTGAWGNERILSRYHRQLFPGPPMRWMAVSGARYRLFSDTKNPICQLERFCMFRACECFNGGGQIHYDRDSGILDRFETRCRRQGT